MSGEGARAQGRAPHGRVRCGGGAWWRVLWLLLAMLAWRAGWQAPSVHARPPTAGAVHAGVGIAYGETFAEGLNPYSYGLALRAGLTFINGFYVGGLAEFYFGDEINAAGTVTSGDGRLFGGALGVDLKMAASVSGRLTAVVGLQQLALSADGAAADAVMQPGDALAAAEARSGDVPFAGPSLELLLLLGDFIYLSPAARLSVLLHDDFPLLTTFSLSLGISL